MTSRSSEIRRCRPLLGTFVEITASGESRQHARAAVEQAFAAAGRVQSLMSFHASHSDVTRLNRLAARRPVEVNPWTYEVLLTAQRLHNSSGGVFDITVATHLQRWGFLPKSDGNRSLSGNPGEQGAIELLPGNRIRFQQPVQIDLGGIAKGFAVDKAVEALQVSGAASGLVNAGGDLRIFGPRASTIHLRHPTAPGQVFPFLQLANAALATSSGYFTRKKWGRRWVTAIVDPRRNRACTCAASVSVRASTCVMADALTKVVMILGKRSASVLRAYSATGFIVTATGEVTATTPPNET